MRTNKIFIGIGGTGGNVLKAFRKRLFADFTKEERARLPIGFLYVDVFDDLLRSGDPSWMVNGEDARFTASEFVSVRNPEMDELLPCLKHYPNLEKVVGDADATVEALGSGLYGTGQKRRAGRLLLDVHIRDFRNALLNQYRTTMERSRRVDSEFHIFVGLGGGLGSGALLEAIAQIRMIPDFNSQSAHVFVHGVLPDPMSCNRGVYYHANAYAALQELNAMMCGNYIPCDVSDDGQKPYLGDDGKFVDGLMLYGSVSENGNVMTGACELPERIAECAYTWAFMEADDNNARLLYMLSFREFGDYAMEYYEHAQGGAMLPYRAKNIGTMNVKHVPDFWNAVSGYMAQQRETDGDKVMLENFVRTLMHDCDALVEFEPSELSRAPGGPNPEPCVGSNICCRTMLFLLPANADKELMGCFKEALRAVVSKDRSMSFDISTGSGEDLTVITFAGLFPMRCLKNLPLYKSRYDSLVGGDDGKQKRIALHTESLTERLPGLELTEMPERQGGDDDLLLNIGGIDFAGLMG